MTLYPDSGLDPRKEILLAKSPFTKALLDPKAVRDPTMWVADLEPHSEQIDNDMERLLGKDWKLIGMVLLAVMASSSRVFSPELPSGSFYNVVNSVVNLVGK